MQARCTALRRVPGTQNVGRQNVGRQPSSVTGESPLHTDGATNQHELRCRQVQLSRLQLAWGRRRQQVHRELRPPQVEPRDEPKPWQSSSQKLCQKEQAGRAAVLQVDPRANKAKPTMARKSQRWVQRKWKGWKNSPSPSTNWKTKVQNFSSSLLYPVLSIILWRSTAL